MCQDFGYSGCGVVFELPKLSNYQPPKIIHAFTGADGASPSTLVINAKNRLFGVTSMNSSAETCSASTYYCGSAFQITPTASAWNTKVLYSFAGGTNSITGPQYGLALDTTGKLYGVSINNVTTTLFTLAGATP